MYNNCAFLKLLYKTTENDFLGESKKVSHHHITIAHSPKVLPSHSTDLLKNYFTSSEDATTGRRQRQNEENNGEEKVVAEMSKNQQRKEIDKQFCIIKIPQASDKDADELFGIVKCLAKH